MTLNNFRGYCFFNIKKLRHVKNKYMTYRFEKDYLIKITIIFYVRNIRMKRISNKRHYNRIGDYRKNTNDKQKV